MAAGSGLRADALICQWGVETEWGNAIDNLNNLGNIRCVEGIPCVDGFSQFPSLDSFCATAILTWHNGEYPGVLASAGQPLRQQLLAIGASPWDAGHYDNGGGPGSSLIAAARKLGLLEVDMYILKGSTAAEWLWIPAARLLIGLTDGQSAASFAQAGAVVIPPVADAEIANIQAAMAAAPAPGGIPAGTTLKIAGTVTTE